VGQKVEWLPHKHKALNSNPSSRRKKMSAVHWMESSCQNKEVAGYRVSTQMIVTLSFTS
jgi:hypothetical protein